MALCEATMDDILDFLKEKGLSEEFGKWIVIRNDKKG